MHSKSQNIEYFTKNADIIVLATGQRNILNCSMVNKKTIIIDVGINFDDNSKIYGDCNFKSFHNQDDCYITPVPGGVGPMTVISIMYNIYLMKLYQTL